MEDTANGKNPSGSNEDHVRFAAPNAGIHNAPAVSSRSGRYVVQIACVPTEQLANQLIAELSSRHINAYAAKIRNPSSAARGTFYRIRINGFNSFSAANVFARRELIGYEFWVDKKAHDTIGIRDSSEIGSTLENNPTR
jgi:cell division septation protein DedD